MKKWGHLYYMNLFLFHAVVLLSDGCNTSVMKLTDSIGYLAIFPTDSNNAVETQIPSLKSCSWKMSANPGKRIRISWKVNVGFLSKNPQTVDGFGSSEESDLSGPSTDCWLPLWFLEGKEVTRAPGSSCRSKIKEWLELYVSKGNVLEIKEVKRLRKSQTVDTWKPIILQYNGDFFCRLFWNSFFFFS